MIFLLLSCMVLVGYIMYKCDCCKNDEDMIEYSDNYILNQYDIVSYLL